MVPGPLIIAVDDLSAADAPTEERVWVDWWELDSALAVTVLSFVAIFAVEVGMNVGLVSTSVVSFMVKLFGALDVVKTLKVAFVSVALKLHVSFGLVEVPI